MRIAVGVLFILFSMIFSPVYADNVISVTAPEGSSRDHLDLRAVGSLFGKCKNLEEFENQLNNPDLGISNLDLNGDGQVDYLRVVEVVRDNVHLITLQSVIGENQFQDVAIIEVEKNNEEEVTVQIIGDAEIYGDDYIIEPTYATPLVFPLLFWATHYRPWHSPSRWGHYPNRYRPWRAYPLALYQSNIQVQINTGSDYHFKKSRGQIIINSPQKGNSKTLGTHQSKTPAPVNRSYSTESSDSRNNNSDNKQGNNRIFTTRPRQ